MVKREGEVTNGNAAKSAKAAEFLKNGVIDGKAVGEAIKSEVAAKVAELKAKHGRVPGLAVIIVGEKKDSQTYVRMKRKACEEAGITSFHKELPESVSQAELIEVVRGFNRDPSCHGILVQLPLPGHLDETAILGEISLEKDVDGFHPLNIGRLCMKGREPLFVPCTPLGCIELLDRIGFEIRGKKAVVVGRSNIVGMPAAMLLNKRDATVTIVHSRTKDAASIVRDADIIIAASGQAEMIKGDWIKEGAVVIDVGTNPIADPSKKQGYRLVGDCQFEECKARALAITPVPGGVGPMTIAMLLRNTLDSCVRHIEEGHVEAAAAPSFLSQTAVVGALAGLAGLVLGWALGGRKGSVSTGTKKAAGPGAARPQFV